jgi:hypothetical protein
MVVLGAAAALYAAAAPAWAIAAQPRPADSRAGTSATAEPSLTAEHRAHVKRHHSKVAEPGSPLVGVFAITAGSCSSSSPTGTYFRMIEPGGTLDGPFLSNGNSPCSVQTYTPLSPGTAGGLSTVSYQPNPTPAFNGSGDGVANSLTQPQDFFGVNFALSTNSTDPQTGQSVAVPSISNSAGALSGNLEAISVAWNNQNFNQGSPKPGGSTPGLTAVPTGTYDAASGVFTLNWASAIVGGPFNNFTGLWHLQGTFKSNSPPPPTTTTTSPTGTSTTVPTGSHTSSSTGSSTTTASAGAQQGNGASDDPSSGTSRSLAMTGLSDDGIYLVLVGLVLAASGIGLLLIQRPTRRARSRRVTR